MIICFLGPDGSGKTTVTDAVVTKVQDNFNGIQRYHLRTFFGNKRKTVDTVSDPHSQENRAWFTSNLKLFYFLLDYWFGYIFLMKKSNLVIFDRYYHDLLIDPKRYRFGGSLYLASFITKFVPEPDIYFVLTAEPSLIQERKNEVSLNETIKQVKLYREFSIKNNRAMLIDTSNDIKTTVDKVTDAILARLK